MQLGMTFPGEAGAHGFHSLQDVQQILERAGQAIVAGFCPLLLNDLRHPRIPAQMPWSTFAGSLGRPRDALAQARRRPGQSPIRINGSP